MNYRLLNADRIIETQRKLKERIDKRFPGSGLSEVAGELLGVADSAARTAEKIRRPHIPMRILVVVILLGALGLLIWLIVSLRFTSDLDNAIPLAEFTESLLGIIVFLGATVFFVITLETRLKRRRALKALHELRAVAHVVDMHQIAKDPEGLRKGRTSPLSDPDEQTTKTLYDLNRYLNYCNELLAIISKIAALYVQEFPDGPTVSAVDQVESLCSGLSHRIWQKVMVLDSLMEETSTQSAV